MLTFSVIRSLDRLGSQIIRNKVMTKLNCEFVIGKRYYSLNSDGDNFDSRSKFKSKEREKEVKHGKSGENNPDVFGQFGVDEDFVMPLKSESLPDDDDGYDTLEINRNRRHILYYKNKFAELIHGSRVGKAKIVEALKLFDDMRMDDRKKVQPYMYTLLISGAAENGYTEKAFELFEEALKAKLKPTFATITALFNACAECPFKEMGLEKAIWLRKWLYEVANIQLNQSQYHAMIKAFGKLGDLKTAYQCVDEMAEKDIAIDTVTFNHLLVASISQPENGFGEAIKLYRRMRFHKIPRELKTYNLLLKATKDCGIGDKENFTKLIHQWFNMDRVKYNEKRRPPKQVNSKKSKLINEPTNPKMSFSNDKVFDYLPDGSVKELNLEELENDTSNDIIQSNNNENGLMLTQPNFLVSSKYLQMSNVINIDYESLSDWRNRFQLIGGTEGFLHLLTSESVKPDIKTFTLMLDLLPGNNQCEDDLIDCMKQFKVKPDTGIFNQIIKRRCYRNDIYSAKKAFAEMQLNQIPVDLATFGVLASGCRNVKMANQFFKDLTDSGFRPNIQIIGAMMKKACFLKDIVTMELILKKMTQFSIPADRRIIDVITLTIEEIDKILWSIEKGKQKAFGHFLNPEFPSNFNKFKRFFEQWASNTDIEINHPWDQFKYQRRDWQYYKMRSFEKTVKSKLMERSEVKKAVESGAKVNVHKLIHDF
ncbi:pentatricopeptide repeat-containing protein 1, mitochondrial-like [Panonychus citri]|uniref:pentatricopeptide repeat-containing protein 1, mitochondrial-like n=1 Tax=Panonychus citri TaxID=50023 RepID=UPI002307C3CE|nr:pentatricopeptide repeat-containing protein 1, mitochondrial-like [Panonychus citri]